jgi:hypothetical protein
VKSLYEPPPVVGSKDDMLIGLKMALMRQGILQYEAARTLRITDTRLSRIICGRLEATDEEKQQLSKMLQTPVEELFADAPPNARSAR